MSRLQPEIRSIREIFASDQYVIPIYQRAYAWGRAEIETLLRDVRDYRKQGAKNYFIGSLVTHARANDPDDVPSFEVVDGQQRLTTLFLVLTAFAESDRRGATVHDNLAFEGRARSTADLRLLAKRGLDAKEDSIQEVGIREGVKTVRSALINDEFAQDDLAYLLDNVKLVRTVLPEDTDLNHYFEVMNSRGEQLEKHEIVKASLMAKLTDVDDGGASSRTLAVVWDACSDMSRHVIAKFETPIRSKLFTDQWDKLAATSFDDVLDALDTSADTLAPARLSLREILAQPVPPDQKGSGNSDEIDRYGSIIDFPNFLLHVLALSDPNRDRFTWDEGAPISLDDKQLVQTFEKAITTAEGVRRFVFTLLKVRYLYDRYVIKTDRSRESEDDSNWVLQRVRKISSTGKSGLSPISTFVGHESADESATSDAHEHVVMLQSMFQVTDNRRAYKNFLYAVLEHLFEQEADVEAVDYIGFLATLAAQRQTTIAPTANLDSGTSVPHFTLNYLDYLLWRGVREDRSGYEDIARRITTRGYRFRYRSSIEHFYPQNPDQASSIEKLPPKTVDKFGNLCLMSRSENSGRSNFTPSAKINQYRSDRQSLKFQMMESLTKQLGTWGVAELEQHGAAMKALLNAATSDAATTRTEHS